MGNSRTPRIWKSNSDGVSWKYIPIPNNQDIRALSRLLIDGCNVIYAWDDKVANYAFRMMALNRESADWRELKPLGAKPMLPQFQWTALKDSSVFIVENSLRRLYVSSDLGRTWDTLNIRSSVYSDAADLICEVSPGTIAIKRDTGFMEVDWKSKELHEPNLPYNTIAYKYFDSLNIIAGVNAQSIGRLGLSRDGGNSWSYLDSIAFLNSPRVLRGNEGSLYSTVIRMRAGTATVYTKKGDIVTSSDRGVTWYDRGNVGELKIENAAQITEDQFGNAIICIGRNVFLVPNGKDSVRIISQSGPKFSLMLRIDSSHYVGIGPSGLYTSNDTGRVWWQPLPPPDLLESSTDHVVGVHPLVIDRLSVNGNGDVSIASSERQAIFRVANTSQTSEYRRLADGYPQFYKFDLVNPEYIDKGRAIIALRGDTAIRKWSYVSIDVVGSSVDHPIGSGEFVASSLSVEDDNDWIAVSDSIYISSNKGVSWTTRASAGLPRDADGRIYETSQIVRLSPTTLLLGFRGIRIVGDSDTTVQRPGGLYRSDDNGATWSRSDAGMGSQTYVWFITKLDESVVLCAAGQVLADTVNAGYNQTGATIMRSTDAGRTWSMVYDEPRGRPAF